MKSNLTTLALSLAVLVTTLLSSPALLANPSAYTRYYITAAITISGMLTAITVLRLLMMVTRRPPSPRPPSKTSPDQRRAYYRLTFGQSPEPLFVQTDDEDLPAGSAAFTCPVKDISETGLSLRCTDVYATGQTVSGKIIFTSGRTAPVNGRVIQEEADRTRLELHCTIDPSLLMAEQRELIESTKNTGPRPAVSRSALEDPDASLPSHRPKGICRKR